VLPVVAGVSTDGYMGAGWRGASSREVKLTTPEAPDSQPKSGDSGRAVVAAARCVV